MAHTIQKYIGEWDTMHNNGPFPTTRLLDTFPDGAIPDLIARYNDCAVEVRRLIDEALQKGEGFRAMGSRWSLNHLPHHRDRIHHNRNMNIIMPIQPGDMHAATPYRSEDLFFLQCGTRIKEISEYLFKKKKALKTTGASNGQTIAGAISTGVHGSAIDVGGIQDYVVGINIINGPAPNDIIYLERDSKPALHDSFIHQFCTHIIRDDKIFNAALVGLGAFGFIHGVVIEAENIYLLRRYYGTIARQDAIHLSETLDFSNTHQLIQTHQHAIAQEVDAQGTGIRPFHFKMVLNPYNSRDAWYAEVMYKKTYYDGYPNPVPLIRHTLSPDTLTFMTGLLTGKKWAVPKALKLLSGNIFPKTNTPHIEGTIGEIFWDALHQGPAYAFAVAFDHSFTGQVLDTFIKVLTDKQKGYIPGAIGVRFVKGTSATLGFTHFGHTCIIELDGTLPRPKSDARKKAMNNLFAFSRHITQELMSKGIDHTYHWGKTADWQQPGLISQMYGPRMQEWKNIRMQLFPNTQLAEMFTNDFIKQTGLA